MIVYKDYLYEEISQNFNEGKSIDDNTLLNITVKDLISYLEEFDVEIEDEEE